MSESQEKAKSKIAPKSDATSPVKTNAEELKSLGGLPEEKDVKGIAKVNSPAGHARPAGSVRV